MEGPDLIAPQDTPYGLLLPPLGQARLKAVEVLYSILSLSDPAAEQGALLFMQHLSAEWLCWVEQWVTQPGSLLASSVSSHIHLRLWAHFSGAAVQG